MAFSPSKILVLPLLVQMHQLINPPLDKSESGWDQGGFCVCCCVWLQYWCTQELSYWNFLWHRCLGRLSTYAIDAQNSLRYINWIRDWYLFNILVELFLPNRQSVKEILQHDCCSCLPRLSVHFNHLPIMMVSNLWSNAETGVKNCMWRSLQQQKHALLVRRSKSSSVKTSKLPGIDWISVACALYGA